MPYISAVERFGIAKGREQGRVEGKIEGKMEGRQETKLEIAKKLLAAGAEHTYVAAITELPLDQIKELQETH